MTRGSPKSPVVYYTVFMPQRLSVPPPASASPPSLASEHHLSLSLPQQPLLAGCQGNHLLGNQPASLGHVHVGRQGCCLLLRLLVALLRVPGRVQAVTAEREGGLKPPLMLIQLMTIQQLLSTYCFPDPGLGPSCTISHLVVPRACKVDAIVPILQTRKQRPRKAQGLPLAGRCQS